MSDKDDSQDLEVTDDPTGDDEQVPDKGKQKRIAELKAELSDLEGKGPEEDVVDADVAEVTDSADDAAEEIAKDGEKTAEEIEAESQDAVIEIADEVEKTGIKLSEAEMDGLADRIADKVTEKTTGGKKESKREPRQRDRAPQPTHWSDKKVGRRRSS